MAILETMNLSWPGATGTHVQLAGRTWIWNMLPRAKPIHFPAVKDAALKLHGHWPPTPSFMLLDEPFAGIDPIAVADIQSIIGKLRDSGIGILITDHNVRETLKITDRAYIINNGEIFRSGSPLELSNDPEVKNLPGGNIQTGLGVCRFNRSFISNSVKNWS